MTNSANKPLNKHNMGTEMFVADVIANIPAASYAGRIFYATDTGNVYRDTGTAWVLIAPIPNATPVSMALGLTHGQLLNFSALTELTTIAAAATSSSVIQIPAGAVVLGVPTYCTVTPTDTSTITVGVSGTAAKFNTGSNISSAATTADKGTKAGPSYFAAATSILFTPDMTPSDALGRIRTTIIYYTITAPTS